MKSVVLILALALFLAAPAESQVLITADGYGPQQLMELRFEIDGSLVPEGELDLSHPDIYIDWAGDRLIGVQSASPCSDYTTRILELDREAGQVEELSLVDGLWVDDISAGPEESQLWLLGKTYAKSHCESNPVQVLYRVDIETGSLLETITPDRRLRGLAHYGDSLYSLAYEDGYHLYEVDGSFLVYVAPVMIDDPNADGSWPKVIDFDGHGGLWLVSGHYKRGLITVPDGWTNLNYSPSPFSGDNWQQFDPHIPLVAVTAGPLHLPVHSVPIGDRPLILLAVSLAVAGGLSIHRL